MQGNRAKDKYTGQGTKLEENDPTPISYKAMQGTAREGVLHKQAPKSKTWRAVFARVWPQGFRYKIESDLSSLKSHYYFALYFFTDVLPSMQFKQERGRYAVFSPHKP